jgi:hypothetical protein
LDARANGVRGDDAGIPRAPPPDRAGIDAAAYDAGPPAPAFLRPRRHDGAAQAGLESWRHSQPVRGVL